MVTTKVEITNLLSVRNRDELRDWLIGNYDKEKECWVIMKRGKRVSDDTFMYLDVVEEALCFGWIDSTVKRISETETAQRLAPRSKKSLWTELNKERVRRMEKLGLMTDAGREVLPNMSSDGFIIDSDIMKALKNDNEICFNFFKFPKLYQRVRINTIQTNKKQSELFQKRLEKLLKNTKKNIMYGEWNDYGRLLDY